MQLNSFPVGLPLDMPGGSWSILYDGTVVRFEASFGLSVAFDGNFTISVDVPLDLYAGEMCGLCGNNDGDPVNDMVTADGTYVGDQVNGGSLIGDSYVVADNERPASVYVEHLLIIDLLAAIRTCTSMTANISNKLLQNLCRIPFNQS